MGLPFLCLDAWRHSISSITAKPGRFAAFGSWQRQTFLQTQSFPTGAAEF